jgi:hypothetical protein
LARLLHASPPPTLAATFAATIALLDQPEAGWLLRRVAENDPGDVHAAALAAVQAIARDGVTADDAAVLLEGAERADNAIYAYMCKPILDAALRPGVTVHQLALMTYGVRNQGAVYANTGSPEIDRVWSRIEAIGRSLPARPAATATAVAAGLTPERLSALILQADLASAVRLLEAGAHMLPVTADLAESLMCTHGGPHGPEDAELWPRLVEALHDALPEGVRAAVLGSVEDRALRVAQDEPLAIGVTVAPAGDEASLTIVLPPRASDAQAPVWDSVAPVGEGELANSTAVAAARRLAAACRELATVEIVTVTPAGQRYRVADHEPGYKRMPTASAFPDRVGVRRSVGFQAAMRRLTAAESWTQVLRQQIAVGTELAALVAEAPARLSTRDNQGRRRTWKARVVATIEAVSALAARPASTGVDPSMSHAQADDQQRRADLPSDALASVANALPRIVEDGPRLPLAMTFRDAADALAAAVAAADPTLSGLGSPIPKALIGDCRLLAGALAALHDDPSGAQRIRAADPHRSAGALIAAAAESCAARQRAILTEHVQGIPHAAIHRVEDPSPPSWAIDATAWVVTAPVEQWDRLCEALAAIPDDARADLAGRVVAAALDGMLAIGAVRLSAFGDQLLLPLGVEGAGPLVEAAGFLSARGPAGVAMSEVIDDLVGLSWQAARDQARPDDWPAVPRDPALTMESLGIAAEAACARLPEPEGKAAMAAFVVLLNHVERELAGPEQVTLAGVVFEAHDATGWSDEEEQIWTALVSLGRLGLASPN